ncbi:VanW family protein [Amycolatopsis jiangsuensis]|uniref:Vancomycin resistance protein YoaR n=1 Tax=Amycolatopsis jiangsuensis TaxID=1181879 RepID=A0A840J2A2_9PSEU|nr:VanW family protein [Amycolatopsis jiangsuensis]MBB4687384.1 vancomycin resistance protein YoaR [Amycolatopsis jiangsuensis]
MREEDRASFADDLLGAPEPEPGAESDLATEIFAVVGERPPPPDTRLRRFRKRLGRGFMVVGCLLGLFVLLYAIDLISTAGDVPRGVRVAGTDVGGLSYAEAEAKLHTELQPRLTRPVAVHAGDVTASLVPAQSGLGLDWSGTLAQAGHQPWSPITRVLSFFTTREVGVVTRSDQVEVAQAVRQLAQGQLDHPMTEGSIGFVPKAPDGVTAYPVEPRQGQQLADVPAAVRTVVDQWLSPRGVSLDMAVAPAKATSAGVHSLLDTVVAPAVSAPVVLHGEGKDTTLKPSAIAASFRFSPGDSGSLQLRIDQGKLRKAARPDLASTETEAKDAQITFDSGAPTVQPSTDARKINWASTFRPLAAVLAKPSGRALKVAYDAKKPELTTDGANALGIKEVIGEFTTSGLSGPAAANVDTLAGRISGVVVKPGETFSLDAHRGGGYAAAPAEDDGSGPSVPGGGLSQLASTLYNAAYLAGLGDGGHVAQQHYLGRYPAGRDAEAVDASGNPVDLKIADNDPTGFAVQASASGGSVTVKIWGTRHYRVESRAGDQTDQVPPSVRIGPGPDGTCQASPGANGFTVTDTRVFYDVATGNEVREESRTTTYSPRPIVICGGGPVPSFATPR